MSNRFSFSGIKQAYETHKNSESVVLTQVGKKKAETFALQGPEYDVLSDLLEKNIMSYGELSASTGFPVKKVRDICSSLEKQECIKKVGK